MQREALRGFRQLPCRRCAHAMPTQRRTYVRTKRMAPFQVISNTCSSKVIQASMLATAARCDVN